ncbi:MAG: translation initiation factor IF-2 [Candidatus Moraniibacteriota bacterium]|nr:MAG: translation initiation factor IF-2 [Candidatus Moranbacteria bacterium]
MDEPKKTVKIPSSVSIKRLSEIFGVPVSAVIMELMKNKILATINEEIDFETASIIAQDMGFETEEDLESDETGTFTLERLLEICAQEKASGKTLDERPPVVTILGHVDHGKTTLLDTIRKTNVAGKEAGGITQAMSAYQVKKRGKLITFIDTPGHEAFSSMRERGVALADIAILVVAADDGVRPQTKEVIAYLRDHALPTIVAINKVDKPEANVARVKQELADHGILIEEWGGNVPAIEISAKHGKNIDKLLEHIVIVSEISEFRSDTKRDGLAVVLESHLDPQKGPVAIALVKTGTLKVGQDVTVGSAHGRIRRLEDFSGKNIEYALPSTPVQLYGLSGTPNTNDVVQVVGSKVAARLKSRERITGGANKKEMQTVRDEHIKKFPLIVKADVHGSLEAIEQIFGTIQSEEIALDIVSRGIGAITESDVKMAESSGALIVGFNVTPTPVAGRMAENAKIEIRSFSIIYKLVEFVKERLAALLPPEIIRTDLGSLSVLAVFKTGKHDMIVGGRVGNGKIAKSSQIEIHRGEEMLGTGRLANLQQNKKNTDEVGSGNECGLTIETPIKIKEGDTLLSFTLEEKRRTL